MVGGGVGENEGEENTCTEAVDGSNGGVVEEKIVLVVGEGRSVVKGTIIVSMVTKSGDCVTVVCSCVLRLEDCAPTVLVTCTVLERSNVCLNVPLEVKSNSCGLSVGCGLLVTAGSSTILVCELGCGLLVTAGSSARWLVEVSCKFSVACGPIVAVVSSTILVCKLTEVGCELSVGCELLVIATILVCELGCRLSVARELLVTAGSPMILVCEWIDIVCEPLTADSSTRLLVEVGRGLAVGSELLITVGSAIILVCERTKVGCGLLVVDREGERGVESATKTRR